MGEHLVLYVDRLTRPPNGQASMADDPILLPIGDGEASSLAVEERNDNVGTPEDEPLIKTAECRICQEEDGIHDLEVPCACKGSLRYAHRKCVQRWCNEKGDIICEICHQPYRPGYTAPPPAPSPEDATIEIGGGWTISGTPSNLHDPRLFTIAETERQFLEAEYDEYAESSISGTEFLRSAALILFAVLLLRRTLIVPDADGDDDDTSAFFSLFLLRAAGFLLPCYIMAWAISILQRRRQRQEAAALRAAQVAFVLHSGQHRGLHFTIAPRPPAAIVPLPQETV